LDPIVILLKIYYLTLLLSYVMSIRG